MRILFICSAKIWGGNEKWVAKTMAGLQSRHEVYFMGKAPHLHKQFGEDIPSFWAPFKSVFDRKTKKAIREVIKDNNIDVVVSTKKKEYFLAGLVTMKLGVIHLLRLGIVRKMKVPFWSRLIYQKLNDGIIVNAHKIKQELLQYRWMKKQPIKVVYNGLDIKNDQEKRNSGKDSGFLIVSTGMLTRRKGFHKLIDAISHLSENKKERVRVHILGKGREEDQLRRQIQKKGLVKVIHLEGFKEPYLWLQRAVLFCLLSRNEGISNALLEAMNCGVPVLTTDAGGSGEFIQHGVNGFLTSGNPGEVAEQLEEIMSMTDDHLMKIGNEGRQTVQTLFNHQRMIEEVESFLHKFI